MTAAAAARQFYLCADRMTSSFAEIPGDPNTCSTRPTELKQTNNSYVNIDPICGWKQLIYNIPTSTSDC